MTNAFTIIPDTERPTERNNMSPITKAVLEGKTVFVDATYNSYSGLHLACKNRGLQLRSHRTTREGVKGMVLWAEKREDKPSA